MLLFRTEEIDAWCAARGRERGGVVPAGRLFPFAVRWYGGRLARPAGGRATGTRRRRSWARPA